MSFLRKLFRTERREVVAFIDVGARAVAGAYVRYVGSETPVVVYSTHLPIEVQDGEAHSAAMLRAVDLLCASLTSEGVPALERTVGRRAVHAVLVSIDAPWQETQVHVEKIVREGDFVFTKSMVTEAVAAVSPAAAGKLYTDASVVGTILNGYEVREPYGKRVHHAAVVILTSRLDEAIEQSLRASVQTLTRSSRITLIAGASLRYQALRVAFPHEHDALILDATGPLPEAALVRKGFLAAVSETPESLVSGRAIQADDFMRGFAELAKSYPLPRTIFLLARFDEMEAMKKVLDSVNFSALWLSDNPPRIIQLLSSHMNGLVRQTTTTPPDLPILLMALYYRYLEKTV